MKAREIIEANIIPDQDVIQDIGFGVDDALEEYQEYLDSNDDLDNMDELASLLNASMDDEHRLYFHVNNDKTKLDMWMTAEAITGETDDGQRVSDMEITINSQNVAGVYGPQTFKKILMRLLNHELVHVGQHARIKDLDNMASGYQKAAGAKTHREWQRKYLRDPHELMAYGETLSQEIADTADPETTMRNPEAFKKQLPTYARFRDTFPLDTPQIKALLKYAYGYLRA